MVLTELVEKDFYTEVEKPVIAALHINTTKNGIELINVASVYGRSLKQIEKSINSDLMYWNIQKGKVFTDKFELQTPEQLNTEIEKGLQSDCGGASIATRDT